MTRLIYCPTNPPPIVRGTYITVSKKCVCRPSPTIQPHSMAVMQREILKEPGHNVKSFFPLTLFSKASQTTGTMISLMKLSLAAALTFVIAALSSERRALRPLIHAASACVMLMPTGASPNIDQQL